MKSDRKGIKDFQEAKAPLNMLKVKMKIKADKCERFKPFYDDIEATTEEQTLFLDELEMQAALADNIDPKQDCFSFKHAQS